MPSPRQERHQARAQARATLPTIRSIIHPYHQAERDNRAFASALISALHQTNNDLGDTFHDATAQQQAISQAAAAHLQGSVAPEFGQAVSGQAQAIGQTSGQELVRQLTAGRTAAGLAPGAVAGRAQLAQTGLQNAMQEALTQRREQFHQAVGQLLPQIHQQNFANMLALKQFGLSQRQLRESTREFNIQAGEQQREFDIQSHMQRIQNRFQRRSFWAQLGLDRQREARLAASAAQRMAGGGYTPSQIAGFQDDAATTIDQAKAGIRNKDYDPSKPAGPNNPKWLVPPNSGLGGPGAGVMEVFRHMVAHGIPPQIAMNAIRTMYPPNVVAFFAEHIISPAQERRREARLGVPKHLRSGSRREREGLPD